MNCQNVIKYANRNVHSILYAYMVQNTSDIIYSVNKYC